MWLNSRSPSPVVHFSSVCARECVATFNLLYSSVAFTKYAIVFSFTFITYYSKLLPYLAYMFLYRGCYMSIFSDISVLYPLQREKKKVFRLKRSWDAKGTTVQIQSIMFPKSTNSWKKAVFEWVPRNNHVFNSRFHRQWAIHSWTEASDKEISLEKTYFILLCLSFNATVEERPNSSIYNNYLME